MELRFPCLPQTFQHTSQSLGGGTDRGQVSQKVPGLPPHPPGSYASFFYPASLQGPYQDLQAPLSAWRVGGGLGCCQPGRHLLPTPSPVTGAGRGAGLQNDRWNFCSQATPHPLDMPFPSRPRNKESLLPPPTGKCQPDLADDVPILPVGAGPGRWARG